MWNSLINYHAVHSHFAQSKVEANQRLLDAKATNASLQWKLTFEQQRVQRLEATLNKVLFCSASIQLFALATLIHLQVIFE